MYARSTPGDDGRTLTFDFAAGLVHDNLLILDRETESLWSQLHGEAVDGPLEGEPLHVVPSMQTTWGHWRELHPDTRVMTVPDEEGRPYLYRAFRPGDARPEEPPADHDVANLGLGLALGGEAVFFPLAELTEARTPLTLELGGRRVTVRHDPEAPTAWAEDADGRLLPGVLAYRDGWMSFHPGSEVFEASRPPAAETDRR